MPKNIVIRDGSETDLVRSTVLNFITPQMNGIDVGSAGSPILFQSISMDRHNGHFSELVNLRGDARNLYWFKDRVLDYLFSGHCLEDFLHEEKGVVIKEWLRVIKVGGLLILNLPDEQLYRNYCKFVGSPNNGDHKDLYFCANKLREIIQVSCGDSVKEIFYQEVKPYSFLIIYQKVK